MSAAPTSASGSTSASASKPKPAAFNKADKYANYSTAASLGFVDADAIVAEREQLALDARAKVGEAGTWETVAVIAPLDPTRDEDEQGEEDARYAFNAGDVKPLTGGILRGSLDDDPGEEARNFRFETDRRPGETGDGPLRRVKPDVYDDGEWDPDSILALGKKAKAEPGTEVKGEVKEETIGGDERVKSEDEERQSGAADAEIKKEEGSAESRPSGSSMFKKRKAPGAANRSVRQKM